MTKKAISYNGLLKEVLDEERKKVKSSGGKFDNKAAFRAAGKRWKAVKAGTDPDFTQGKSLPRKKTKGKKTKVKRTKGNKSLKKSKKSKKSDKSNEVTIKIILSNPDICDDCKNTIRSL